MLAAGGGRLFNDASQGLAFDAGIILEIFTTRFLTFRLDLRDLMVVQEAVAESRLANNILVTGGLTVWIPTGL
jgi:hypothetical protein